MHDRVSPCLQRFGVCIADLQHACNMCRQGGWGRHGCTGIPDYSVCLCDMLWPCCGLTCEQPSRAARGHVCIYLERGLDIQGAGSCCAGSEFSRLPIARSCSEGAAWHDGEEKQTPCRKHFIALISCTLRVALKPSNTATRQHGLDNCFPDSRLWSYRGHPQVSEDLTA